MRGEVYEKKKSISVDKEKISKGGLINENGRTRK